MTDADLGAAGADAGGAEPSVGIGDPSASPGPAEPAEPAIDATGSAGAEPSVRPAASVEELIVDLERATAERDAYLDQLRRNQAEFENAKKRLARQASDAADHAAGQLAEKLLPVLDACEAAIEHGATEVEPVFAALLGTLEKEGLARLHPAGEPFDPTVHEAVFHEPGEPGDDGTVVVDVLRSGYAWTGRVVRPAMVKVRG